MWLGNCVSGDGADDGCCAMLAEMDSRPLANDLTPLYRELVTSTRLCCYYE